MNIFVLSDLHGDWRPAFNFYKKNKHILNNDPKMNLMLILGDLGANYFLNERDDKFKKRLSELPFTYLCLRGNHEERPTLLPNFDKDYLIETYCGGEVYWDCHYPNIMYMKDSGEVYTLDGKTFLTIPGAYSIDKDYRLASGWSWFSQEQLNKNERAYILNNLKPHYDYILTHTCPHSWEPYISDLFFDGINQSRVDKTTEDFLDTVVNSTHYDYYLFGHYHDDRDIQAVKAHMIFHEGLVLKKGNEWQKI